MANIIPQILEDVTWFCRSNRLTEMMEIRLVTFATAYVNGATSLMIVKAKMFCIQCKTPSITSKNITPLLTEFSLVRSEATLLKSMKSQTGKNIKHAILPRVQSNRRWCTPVSFKTFFEKMLITLNPPVASKAELSPVKSKDTSVTVAIPTPTIMGRRER